MENNVFEIISNIDSERDFLGNLLEGVRMEFGLCDEYYDQKQFLLQQQKYEEFIKKSFNEIKLKNKKYYDFLITLLFHDLCIMLNTSEEPENKKFLLHLQEKVKTKEDLEKIIEEDQTYLMDMVLFFLDFNELNYYERRKRIRASKNIGLYLKKIYKLKIIDDLFYTKEIELNDLINMYNEADFIRKFGMKFDPIKYTIGNIKNLAYNDKQNSIDLIIKLISRTYKYLLFEYDIKRINDVVSYKLNELIKKSDLKGISNEVISNDSYLKLVLEYFFDAEFNYDENYKKQVRDYYNLKENEDIKKKLMVKGNGSN